MPVKRWRFVGPLPRKRRWVGTARAPTTQKSGYATLGSIGVGAGASIFVESGLAAVGCNAYGQGVQLGQVIKTGVGIAGCNGSGANNWILDKTSFATVGGVGVGSKSVTHIKAGYAATGCVATGTSTSVTQETGYAIVTVAGTGSSASVTVERGYGVVGADGYAEHFTIFTKSGSGIVGTDAYGTCAKFTDYTKDGFGVVGTVGTGGYVYIVPIYYVRPPLAHSILISRPPVGVLTERERAHARGYREKKDNLGYGLNFGKGCAIMRAVKGDTNVYDISVVRQNAAVNLTGAKVWFTAKIDEDDADIDAAIALDSASDPTQVAIIAPIQGKAQVTLFPADTENLTRVAYHCDIQVLEQNGTVTTIVSDVLHIVRDVTRSRA